MRVQVPFLSLKEIERSADELLARYSRCRGALCGAVDVDFVIERVLGLDLAVIDLKGLLGNPDVLGATVIDQKGIYVDQSLEQNPGRFAFTLAHEVGHWVLHRPHLAAHPEGSALFDLSEFIEPQPACGPGKKPRVEWQADQFAACLLMPGRLVRAAVHDAFGGRLPTWEGIQARLRTRQLDPTFIDVAAQVIAAGSFDNVSNTAMRIRLLDLKLVVDASDPQRSLL
jgi:Zn-dependent peptidase ImmA (M78 family)